MMNIHKISLFFCTLLAGVIVLGGCHGSAKKGTISGTLSGAEGKTIQLKRAVNNQLVGTDSTIIGSDGSFNLVPSKPLTMDFYVLSIDPEHYLTIVTDSTEALELKGEFADLQGTVKASGSPATEALRALELQCAPINKKDKEAIARATQGNISDEEKAQIRQSMNDSRKQRTEIIKSWLDENASSLSALIVVNQLDARADAAYYDKVFEALGPQYGEMPIYKALKQESALRKNPPKPMPGSSEPQGLAIGSVAPEIVMPDVNGKTRKLSDLRGKTVLIDFWASWCGPCRGENPNVVKAYEKYNKDGFEVFSVSLDRAKEPWVEAIAKDGLKWPNHVSELKHWESSAGRDYGVHSIPKTYLIDKDGKIIGSDLRGAALEAKLQAIYGH